MPNATTSEVTGSVARLSAVQVLDRAFSILNLFTEERAAWSLGEIARELGLSLPTVHRIVQSLLAHGYLWSDPGATRRYRLGVSALVLGVRAERTLDLVAAAAPALRHLSTFTGETSYVLVPSEDRKYSVCIASAEGTERLRLSVDVGRRIDITQGAGQKALLAFFPEAERREIMRISTQPAELEKELAGIRETGWAMTFEETHPGTWGFAVSIVNAEESIVAAIGLSGPILRYSKESSERWLAECLKTVSSFASELHMRVPAQRPLTGLPTRR